MKTQAECFPCFIKQALIAATIAGGSDELQKKALQEAASLLFTASLDRDPPYIATDIFHAVYRIMGTPDPYRAVKEEYNTIAAHKQKELIGQINKSIDTLRTAIKISLAGNIIDFGIQDSFDLDQALRDALEKEPAIDHYEQMKESLSRGKKLLFLVDNAGEIGFDALLLDELQRLYRDIVITVAVKKIPIINDATILDAIFFGIEKKYRIIDNGSHHVGTFLPSCSSEMIDAYNQADVVIVKGQANWESLEETADKRVFFLLKAKCACVARFLGVALGETVIQQGKK